ncbi:MAG: hypothetical protein ABIM44_07595 [candidate division WOR-3 bacterium]
MYRPLMNRKTVNKTVLKQLKSYLRHLGFSDLRRKILFVTTNDLAEMSFCPNKTYLQVNYLGGISEYDLRFRIKDRDSINKLFKKKAKWKLTESDLERYVLEELISFRFLSNGIKFFPKEMQSWKIRLRVSGGTKQLVDSGIFHSRFRINFGLSPFFISAVPDIVLIEKGRIEGVIEVKSSRKTPYKIFPSEYEQVEFYKLYIMKRALPVYDDAYFLTLKGESESPEALEEELVDFLFSTRKFGKESVKDFADSHGYLIREVEKSLEDIWQALNERIKLLVQDSPPSVYCKMA